MDFALTNEQALLAATLRRFAENELQAVAADADRQARAPANLLDTGAALGLGLDAVPEAAGGCMDESFAHVARALRGFELGRGCAGLASLFECNVEPALALQKWGDSTLARSVFDELAEGALLTMTHDAAGRLHVDMDPVPVLHGCTGLVPVAARAAHMLVLTSDASGEDLVAFVPKSSAAITPVHCSGWRAGAWARWNFAAYRFAEKELLLRGAEATSAKREILSWSNISLAARAIGVASCATAHAATYGQERVQFGQAIGDFESIIRLIDRNETQIAAGRVLVLQAADAIDRGATNAVDLASRARDFCCEVVTRATIDGVQIYGGYGFVNDYPVEKLMRDARAFEALHGNEAFARVLARKRGSTD